MAIATDILAFVSVVLGVVFSLMIVHEVSKRGVKINIFRLKLSIIKYFDQYKQLTRKETGKVGPLYYLGIGSFVAALVFAIIHLIAR
ncbi:MAG: hypothetical protein MUQ25_07255 [Candidatus Aminicenantes bacterium]|nr:hypothetical protein [Candidatus Aminicenantes bacterium]